MAVHQLLYVSGAARQMSATDFAEILTASRRNNRQLSVTGMLLYADGAFIQILEGDQKTVHALSRKIAQDPRHRNFMVLAELDAATRAFADWEMGFKQVERDLPSHAPIFRASRASLEGKIAQDDGGALLAMVMAFARDFMSDK